MKLKHDWTQVCGEYLDMNDGRDINECCSCGDKAICAAYLTHNTVFKKIKGWFIWTDNRFLNWKYHSRESYNNKKERLIVWLVRLIRQQQD